MEKRKLGRTDMEVAPLAFGGNVFGWTADEKTSFSEPKNYRSPMPPMGGAQLSQQDLAAVAAYVWAALGHQRARGQK